MMSKYRDDLGCVEMPCDPPLKFQHLENCRVVPDREAILQTVQPDSIAIEVGVQKGNFSRSILDICQPAKLYLIDLDLYGFGVPERFKDEIAAGTVEIHEGDSSSILATFPDEYFDFIYIDADHRYTGVKKDIEVGKSKLKTEGLMIFNDSTYWSPGECQRYGVIEAVNGLCLEEN